MASRFPSIEEFDDGATADIQSGTSALDLGLGDDPQADFLSREKATLGDDADMFATEGDNALLSGGGDDEFANQFPSLNVGNEVRPSTIYHSHRQLAQLSSALPPRLPQLLMLFSTYSKLDPVAPSPVLTLPNLTSRVL